MCVCELKTKHKSNKQEKCISYYIVITLYRWHEVVTNRAGPHLYIYILFLLGYQHVIVCVGGVCLCYAWGVGGGGVAGGRGACVHERVGVF